MAPRLPSAVLLPLALLGWACAGGTTNFPRPPGNPLSATDTPVPSRSPSEDPTETLEGERTPPSLVLPTPTDAGSHKGGDRGGGWSPDAPHRATGSSHALLIGNSHYRWGWSPLPGVQEDLARLTPLLECAGFQVTVEEDLTRREMEAAIKGFLTFHGGDPSRQILIYYSGHGKTLPQQDHAQMGYLVPTDAPVPLPSPGPFKEGALSVRQLDTWAREMDAQHVLFALDACYAGALVEMQARASSHPPEDRWEDPVRFFLSSGRGDEAVPDKSVFRTYLLQGLAGEAPQRSPGLVTAHDLAAYIATLTESHPSAPQPIGGVGGDPRRAGTFLFNVPDPICLAKRGIGVKEGDPERSLSSELSPPSPATPEPGGRRPPIDWVAISGGTFEMGSQGGSLTAQPTQTRKVRGLCLSRTEVTVAQYDACVVAGACTPTGTLDPACNGADPTLGDHPINCVNWQQARDFATWVHGRLPTEMEWEYAARYGHGGAYPWGSEPPTCERANHRAGRSDCDGGRTRPVCQSSLGEQSHTGLCDLSGNVAEWMQDGWDPRAYHLEQLPVTGSQRERVHRGGSWGSPGIHLSTTWRGYADQALQLPELGFRVATDACLGSP